MSPRRPRPGSRRRRGDSSGTRLAGGRAAIAWPSGGRLASRPASCSPGARAGLLVPAPRHTTAAPAPAADRRGRRSPARSWTAAGSHASPRGSSRHGRRRARAAGSQSRPTRPPAVRGPGSRRLHTPDLPLTPRRRRTARHRSTRSERRSRSRTRGRGGRVRQSPGAGRWRRRCAPLPRPRCRPAAPATRQSAPRRTVRRVLVEGGATSRGREPTGSARLSPTRPARHRRRVRGSE